MASLTTFTTPAGFKDPKIAKGHILVYRLFDVAESIKVNELEKVLLNQRGAEKFNVPKFIDRALVMKQPPMAYGLGDVTLNVDGANVQANLIAKMRDYGVISLIYQIPIEPSTKWSELVCKAVDLEEGSEIDAHAEAFLPKFCDQIKSTLDKPTNSDQFEDYIVYYIEKFEDPIPIAEVLTSVDIPALLLAEHEVELSANSRKAALENAYQYGRNDLAIVEWNAALVIEPSGGREIPDILEFAVSHLLEMRFYDDLLDRRLQGLYDDIEKKRKGIWSNRFDDVYDESSARYIEFTEFIEKVENSLKVVGDFYLASLYRAAMKKFRLPDWQNSVTRKMAILGQVSSLLQGQVNNRRSHLLEIVIIILIAFEILSAIWN